MRKLKNMLDTFFAFKIRKRKVLPANAKITHETPNIFRTMKIPHIAGSLLGLVSTRGATGNSAANLRFSWFSLKTAYTFFYLIVECFLTCVDVRTFLGGSKRSLFSASINSI